MAIAWDEQTASANSSERAYGYASSTGEEYLPTPAEIAAECRKIREGWSERDHWRRAGYLNGRGRWEPSTHRVNRGLMGFVDEMTRF